MTMDNGNLQFLKDIRPMSEANIERMHKMYFYNVNWLFKIMLNLCWRFIPEKTREKMTFTDSDKFLQDMDVSELPSELGGSASYTLAEAFDNTLAIYKE